MQKINLLFFIHFFIIQVCVAGEYILPNISDTEINFFTQKINTIKENNSFTNNVKIQILLSDDEFFLLHHNEIDFSRVKQFFMTKKEESLLNLSKKYKEFLIKNFAPKIYKHLKEEIFFRNFLKQMKEFEEQTFQLNFLNRKEAIPLMANDLIYLIRMQLQLFQVKERERFVNWRPFVEELLLTINPIIIKQLGFLELISKNFVNAELSTQWNKEIKFIKKSFSTNDFQSLIGLFDKKNVIFLNTKLLEENEKEYIAGNLQDVVDEYFLLRNQIDFFVKFKLQTCEFMYICEKEYEKNITLGLQREIDFFCQEIDSEKTRKLFKFLELEKMKVIDCTQDELLFLSKNFKDQIEHDFPFVKKPSKLKKKINDVIEKIRNNNFENIDWKDLPYTLYAYIRYAHQDSLQQKINFLQSFHPWNSDNADYQEKLIQLFSIVHDYYKVALGEDPVLEAEEINQEIVMHGAGVYFESVKQSLNEILALDSLDEADFEAVANKIRNCMVYTETAERFFKVDIDFENYKNDLIELATQINNRDDSDIRSALLVQNCNALYYNKNNRLFDGLYKEHVPSVEEILFPLYEKKDELSKQNQNAKNVKNQLIENIQYMQIQINNLEGKSLEVKDVLQELSWKQRLNPFNEDSIIISGISNWVYRNGLKKVIEFFAPSMKSSGLQKRKNKGPQTLRTKFWQKVGSVVMHFAKKEFKKQGIKFPSNSLYAQRKGPFQMLKAVTQTAKYNNHTRPSYENRKLYEDLEKETAAIARDLIFERNIKREELLEKYHIK